MKIIIALEGGLVSSVATDYPGTVDLSIVDFDTEGCDPSKLTCYPTKDHTGKEKVGEAVVMLNYPTDDLEDWKDAAAHKAVEAAAAEFVTEQLGLKKE